jgi:predicted transposase/invertase (TIGR01784 family)
MAKNVYDISLKKMIAGLEGAFTELFLGFKIKEASEPLNVELAKIEEKKADFVCKIIDENEKKSILHIEFQTSNHKEMHFRMLRYLTELYKKYELPIIQLVIYLGKEKMVMEDNIKFEIKDTKIDYKYKLVNIKEINCERLINSNNSNLVVLGILCDFKNKDVKDVIRKILKKLEELCKNDNNELNNKIFKLEVFSKLRNLTEIVKKEEEMLEDTIKMQDLPSYAFGLDRGLEEGREEGIQIGQKKGIEKEKLEIAKNLILAKIELNIIKKTTGLSLREIKNIKVE